MLILGQAPSPAGTPKRKSVLITGRFERGRRLGRGKSGYNGFDSEERERPVLRRIVVFSSVGFLLGLGSLLLWAQQPEAEASDPEILSMFPLAGERGKVWQAELRGRFLHGAYAVWFDCKELSAVRGKLRQRTVSLYRSMSYGLFCPGTI